MLPLQQWHFPKTGIPKNWLSNYLAGPIWQAFFRTDLWFNALLSRHFVFPELLYAEPPICSSLSFSPMYFKTTFFKKAGTLAALAGLLLPALSSHAQKGVYAPFIDSTSVTSSSKTYDTLLAPGASGTVTAGKHTYRFGSAVQAGTPGGAFQKRTLKAFSADGKRYAFTANTATVKVRRSRNYGIGSYINLYNIPGAAVPLERDLAYYEGTYTAPAGSNNGTVNSLHPYVATMDSLFTANDVTVGTDNLFSNVVSEGNFNNIERLDVYFAGNTGITLPNPALQGFGIFERGLAGEHEPAVLAIITGIDGNGLPTSYAPKLIFLKATDYDPAGQPTANYVRQNNIGYTILRRDKVTENLKASTRIATAQGIGGTLLTFADFGIAANARVYGYSIMAADFYTAQGTTDAARNTALTNGTAASRAVNFNDSTTANGGSGSFPHNTASDRSGGGIDLAGITGLVQVVKISGTVYNDPNGITDGKVDGTALGNPGGTTLYALLVDSITNNLVASVQVDANGNFSFDNTALGRLWVRLSTTAGTVGSPAPATSLPTGWANAGGDRGTQNAAGTGIISNLADGNIPVLLERGDVTGLKFAIEQRPTAGTNTVDGGANPGGTAQAAINGAAFTSSDPSPGAVTSILITAFPTGATSIKINGVTYGTGTGSTAFPAGGVTTATNATGQPTTPISVDPAFDGAGKVVIQFKAVDAAGIASTDPGTATVRFAGAISGTVFNDPNGLNNSKIDGTGVTGLTGLNALLVNTNNSVVAATSVSTTNGTYTFSGVYEGNYSILITTATANPGNPAPTVMLPAGWVSVGEVNCVNTAGCTGADGNPNGILPINSFTGTITQANFGIEQRPTAGSGTFDAGANPGGTASVTVTPSAFTSTANSTDPSPAPNGVTNLEITKFPTGATSITIAGTNYVPGNFPNNGLVITADSTGKPTQTISVDPAFTGAGTVAIEFKAFDAAGIASANAGTATVRFAASISGTVFNDVNGLSDTLVNGTGTNAGGLKAVLVNNTNNTVVAGTPVAANGTYTLSGVYSDTYKLLITSNPYTVGSAAPAVALPAGWVVTGEQNCGTTAGCNGADGTADGILTITNFADAIAQANFGIEQPPTAGSGFFSAADTSSATPAAITVADTAFANITASTDPAPGAVTGIRIVAFPANASELTVNGASYTSATFPGTGIVVPTDASGQPAQTIRVTPGFRGADTVKIRFVARDAAEKESADTGNVDVIFFTYISGRFYNDANGMSDNIVNATGTNKDIPAGLYAVLVNNLTNRVVDFRSVNANSTGTASYDFDLVYGGFYSVVITTNTPSKGQPAPAAALPADWYVVGTKNCGLGTSCNGSDGTTGTLDLGLVGVPVFGANFGIDRRPTAVAVNDSLSRQPLPNDVLSLTGNPGEAPALTATDPEEGAFDGSTNNRTLVINTLPVDGQLTYGGTAITTSDFVISNFDQTLLQLELTGRSYSGVSFTYSYRDAAGVASAPVSYQLGWGDPLPVKLLAFEGRATESGARLRWETGSEAGTKGFYVVRSTDAVNWTQIGFVEARSEGGVSNEGFEYTYEDARPGRGVYYYQLVMADVDGQTARSQTVRLTFGEQGRALSVYPNPAQQTVFVGGSGVEAIALTDLQGRTLPVTVTQPSAGLWQVETGALASGFYMLSIRQNGETHAVRIQVRQP